MKSNFQRVHWAILGSVGAVLLAGTASARAHSVYANFVSTDGLGNFTYQIQFSNTAPANASIFAKNGGLEFDSYPGFVSAAISAAQFGSTSDWTMTTGVDWAKFIYNGNMTTNVSGTNLLTVVLHSNNTVLNPIKSNPTIGYDFTDQSGVPGASQTNSGNVEGPGLGAVAPLPAAVWAGLSLLAGMGAFGAMRRRIRA